MATRVPSLLPLAAAVTLLGLLAALVTAAPPGRAQSTTTSDALLVVKSEETPSNVELAVRLSEATPLPDTSTVVMGRSDVFADSLASGVLQSRSPLLLIPPQGPVPDRVLAELQRLGADRVILLGGTSAIGEVVEQQLVGSYAVERRAGTTRIETATTIAAMDAPQATTAVLARAFPSPGGDQSQAFADALAAGGMAAELEAPVLLTSTDTLPASTRDYLTSSTIEEVLIVGGTAAISQGVEDEVRGMGMATARISGPTRFDTAVAVADQLGAQGADDVERVTLVEGQGADAWAGGFAAAAHSAHFDAPIVLASGDALPAPTSTFLAANTGGFAVPTTATDEPVLTCVTPIAACETARIDLGLPPSANVVFVPASATTLTPGQEVTVTVEGGSTAFAQAAEVTIDGTCLDQPTTAPLEDGTYTVVTSTTLPEPCTLTVGVPLSNGSTQTTTATYPGGTISGTVRSATTDEPVVGATVTLSSGASATTGTAGEYTFTDLPGGSYVLTAAADGYVPGAPTTVDVVPAQDTAATLLLSPELAAGSLRIVLSWDDDPADLDSHLWTPESQPYHVFYGPRGSLEACPFAALDIDDVSGFGPETITISQAIPGTYRYAVHRFSGGETLSQSNAVVQVFDSTGLVAEMAVPLNGTFEHIWWHVFDLDATNGTIVPANRLLTDEAAVAPYATPNAC